MKTKRTTYFSLFFLLSFLTSIGINTYQVNNFQKRTVSKQVTDIQLSGASNSNAASCSLIFEEENEQEEDGLEAQVYLIPFLFSFHYFEISHPHVISEASITKEPHNPIYIEVCNFRI